MKKVLLVEDNARLSYALSLRLKATGYTMINAKTISSGLSNVVQRKPDVTLIDINLPDGNGFKLAEQILSNPNSPHTPIVFITACKSRGLREEAVKYSPVAFLEKPFDAGDLIEAIERAQYSTPEFAAKVVLAVDR